MKPEAQSETPRSRPEDLRIFLVLGIPIIVISVSLALFVVNFGPTKGL